MSQNKPSAKSSKGNDPGLFEDLETFSTHELTERINSERANLKAAEMQKKRFQDERQAEISIVQSMRAMHETNKGMNKERNSILDKFRSTREKATELKKQRDQINENIPPPLEIIEERLIQTYARLSTMPSDLSMMPNRNHEIKLFSFFFELQEMHAKKKFGNKLHQEYITLLRDQGEMLKDLDQMKAEMGSNKTDKGEKTGAKGAKPKDIRKQNERISDMLDEIKKQSSIIKKIRKEIGRTEAYLRMRKKSDRQNKGRRISPRIEDVKAKAVSGGSLSIEEMSALLKAGNISALSEKDDAEKKTGNQSGKKRRRKSGAARGTRRTLDSTERDSRQR